MKYLRPLKHYDHGFEYHSRQECLSEFSTAVLYCVKQRPCDGLIPVRALPTPYKISNFRMKAADHIGRVV
jgi:hypothetical protein